ncbi:ABC transporter permease [Amaricoccus solimangrovi]|uniref:Iron ABC transporter permease n=1 Tax=Amaricoccus solimangrovi TaxID=2589815 RepID=A0A501WMZ9_9RHOB|nr:ABC transporter permease subunit [Amaricoccus solimangrovi]TPE47116.1 iron ABC transporter permease [Amaricoccus solimangrovi]
MSSTIQMSPSGPGGIALGGRAPRLRARRISPFMMFNVGLLAVFIIGLLYPIAKALVWAFYSDGSWDLSAFGQFAANDDAMRSVPVTLLIVGCASLVATTMGLVLAYLNERTDARMGLFTDMIPFIPLLMPSIAGAFGWVLALSPRIGYVNQLWMAIFGTAGPFNAFSVPALIFVYSIHGTTFAFLIISAALRNLDPSLEEQSRLCGASRGRTLTRVVLPAMLPSIAAAVLLVIWTTMGGLAVPAAMAQPAGIPIMSVQILRFLQFDYPPQYGPALVMAFIMVGIIGAVWLAAARIRKLGRHGTVGGKTRVAARRSLGRWKWVARGFILLWATIVVLVPLTCLALVALNGYWAGHLRLDNMSVAHILSVFEPGSLNLISLLNSVKAALIVATIGSVIAAIFSVFVTSRKSKLVTVADGVMKLPTILPGLVLAIGFVLAYAGRPFDLGGTFLILVIAFLLEQVPKGTLTTDPIAAQVGRELTEASQVSGASGFRTFWKVHFPLMLPGTIVAWALLFVHVIGDLDTSALVASVHNPTIGSQMLRLGENGDYPAVAALALLVVLMSTTTVTTVFVLSRGRKWA